MYDCICTGYTAAAGRYRCYECSYTNYDYQGDYNCVTSPWNATNGRLRECERDTAETCVTKTVYTKGTGTAVLFITSIDAFMKQVTYVKHYYSYSDITCICLFKECVISIRKNCLIAYMYIHVKFLLLRRSTIQLENTLRQK